MDFAGRRTGKNLGFAHAFYDSYQRIIPTTGRLESSPADPSSQGVAVRRHAGELGNAHLGAHHVEKASPIYCWRIPTAAASMPANCWDNAPKESFFALLKKELVYDADFATGAEARAALFEYIEVFYNGQRRHFSLGYVSPVEYEQSATP